VIVIVQGQLWGFCDIQQAGMQPVRGAALDAAVDVSPKKRAHTVEPASALANKAYKVQHS